MSRAPRLLGFFHLYPPQHNAGAEWMAHSILTRLQRDYGWEVQVVTARPPRRRGSFQGIPVEMQRDARRWSQSFRWCDVAMTHLDVTRAAMGQAARARVPLVHLVHNDAQLTFHKVPPERAQLVVANSEWIADAISGHGSPTTVVYPPVWCEEYEVEQTGDAVTLVNLSRAKGVEVFYELAARFPQTPFLAVEGSYGEQLYPPAELRNVRVVKNTPDIRQVWRQTRLVLMPSSYESWGRVAIEAAAAGIPSLAAPTPGLIETGVPAAFCTVEPVPDLDAWERHLAMLINDEEEWAKESARAREQAAALEADSHRQLAELDQQLRALLPASFRADEIAETVAAVRNAWVTAGFAEPPRPNPASLVRSALPRVWVEREPGQAGKAQLDADLARLAALAEE